MEEEGGKGKSCFSKKKEKFRARNSFPSSFFLRGWGGVIIPASKKGEEEEEGGTKEANKKVLAKKSLLRKS